MSEAALKEFENARTAQLQRNEARRMRTLVNQARGDIHRSGNRWPFELTQNAHDPGPRPGFHEVNLSLSFDGQWITYEHDGKPFTMQDLAALQSGGSSKDFESKVTTGRFGTGFLLTHVLAYQINFEGILQTGAGFEKVELQLDRSGDEDKIYANTLACGGAIGRASPIPGLDGLMTARFRYSTDNNEAARMGMASFSNALPHLYGTCEHLGKVEVRMEDGRFLLFQPTEPSERVANGMHIRERRVAVFENEKPSKVFRALRIRKSIDSPSSLIVILEEANGGWHIPPLQSDFPRLFCRFPIRTSDFLPANIVTDGRFNLSQERDSILMTDPDKNQIAEALALLPSIVQMALSENWHMGFSLARMGMPKLVFGEALDEPSKIWWKATLFSITESFAQLPIVRTANGELHKIAGPAPQADFVIPRFDSNQPTDELDFDAVWRTANETKEALPPDIAVAAGWTSLVEEWKTLGTASERVGLTEIADLARGKAKKLGDLETKTAALDWLSQFLSLVGQIAGSHNCSKMLDGLLPDQNGFLKSPLALKRDAGLDEQLKDISASIKLNLRSRLLSKELSGRAAELRAAELAYPHLKSLLDSQIPHSLTSTTAIDECLQELSKQLPDTKLIADENNHFRDASIDLLRYLWDTQGKAAAELAQKCPLIASDGSAVRWSPQRKMMAPVSFWHQDARPFAVIYKADRILSENYLTRFDGDGVLVNALVAWNMAFADPLCIDTPKDLTGDRLKAISTSTDCEGITVNSRQFSQIALLPTELIQRCQSDPTLAGSLLGLALCYTARHDKTWEQSVTISARRNREDVSVTLTPALWIADLKTKAWISVPGDEGYANVMPNAGNLGPLLKASWLEGNDMAVRLLTQFFGFKELDLRLLATAPTSELRKQVESGLAMIVQTLGSDAAQYTALASALETKKRRDEEKERNRKFGFAVQAAIKKCLEANKLNLILVDNGYDYDIYLDDAPPVEAGSHHLQLADYLLEVKATTSGEVRLTPSQARTASERPDHFILCVVDLRGITHDRMEGEWTAADVEPRTKIIQGIGKLANQPHGLVAQAKGCEIGLRNDNSLRYGVPVQIWEKGVSVSAWVGQLAAAPKNSAAANRPTTTDIAADVPIIT